MMPAEKLAAKIRELIEAQRDKDGFETQYVESATLTREADSGTDAGFALFTVLFEGCEYDVHIGPNGADAE